MDRYSTSGARRMTICHSWKRSALCRVYFSENDRSLPSGAVVWREEVPGITGSNPSSVFGTKRRQIV